MFYLLKVMMALAVLASSACSYHSESKKVRESSVVSFDGTEIVYGTKGKGDLALVFVHCWTCNSTFWEDQIDPFAMNHQVVWLDLAGHGKSSGTRSEYSIKSFGKDVAAVVNQLDVEKVVLVGHSMGGPVSLEAAELLGDKVVGIVGVDTFYTSFIYPKDKDQIKTFVQPFEDDFRLASDNLIRSMFTSEVDSNVINTVLKLMASADKSMAVSAMYHLFYWSAENNPAILNKYEGKLFNINADPTYEAEASHSSVTLVRGVGHFVPQAKPDEFNAALFNILKVL
ncbi:alpha/beta hydrolase [Litoribacillus peritrichatus]